MELKDVKYVRTTWAFDGSAYVYESIEGSVSTNAELESIRFELKEIDGTDDNLEVVIQKRGNEFFFKTDYYGDPEKEFQLNLYSSSDAFLFFYSGENGLAYFHLNE